MDTVDTVVLLACVALIALVLWYFFGPREAVAATAGAGGVQQIKVTVKGGYSPDVIVVRQGAPVRLDFYRDETASCSEDVVFPDFSISRHLPAYKTTAIEFTPQNPGEFHLRHEHDAGEGHRRTSFTSLQRHVPHFRRLGDLRKVERSGRA